MKTDVNGCSTCPAGAAAGRLLFDGDAEEKLLTTNEVAERMGVSPRRVRALAQSRKVGQQVAGAWLFRLEDLVRLQPDTRYRQRRNT